MYARLAASPSASDSARSRSAQRRMRTISHQWKYRPLAVAMKMMK